VECQLYSAIAQLRSMQADAGVELATEFRRGLFYASSTDCCDTLIGV